jgi:hypothetical protein
MMTAMSLGLNRNFDITSVIWSHQRDACIFTLETTTGYLGGHCCVPGVRTGNVTSLEMGHRDWSSDRLLWAVNHPFGFFLAQY